MTCINSRIQAHSWNKMMSWLVDKTLFSHVVKINRSTLRAFTHRGIFGCFSETDSHLPVCEAYSIGKINIHAQGLIGWNQSVWTFQNFSLCSIDMLTLLGEKEHQWGRFFFVTMLIFEVILDSSLELEQVCSGLLIQ